MKYTEMDYVGLLNEIRRVEGAIARSRSPYVKRDYGKYLKKLNKRRNELWKSSKSN